MSVAPQPFAAPRRTRTNRMQAVPAVPPSYSSPQRGDRQVERLPPPRKAPLWLRSLLLLQRSSTLVCCLLVAAALLAYARAVHSQQLWAREYRKLSTLQHQERQLAAKSAVLKNQLANWEDLAGSGLVPPKPGNHIFLPVAPPRPPVQPPAKPVPIQPATLPPLGY